MTTTTMNLAKHRLTITPTTNLTLPSYKPLTFRGGFGHALRRVMCVNTGETCTKYPLKSACVHTYIFETTPQQVMNGKSEDAPHPFIIEPPLDEMRHYSRDDNSDPHPPHTGQVINYAPYFIFAFEVRNRGRCRVVDLMNIGCEGEILTQYGDSNIRDSQQMINTINKIHEASQLNHHRIAFRFLAPIRIRYKAGS